MILTIRGNSFSVSCNNVPWTLFIVSRTSFLYIVDLITDIDRAVALHILYYA
jgi:hypothetical protein